MASRKHTAFGEIDASGIARSYDKEGTIAWAAQHPGARLEITYKVIKGQGEGDSQRAYYRAVVIPNVLQGLKNRGYRMDENQVHDFLRQNSTVRVTYYDIEDRTVQQIDSTGDFTKDDWTEYLDEVIQYAAENLDIRIPDAIQPDDRLDLTKANNKKRNT